jgi:hypothetical protein
MQNHKNKTLKGPNFDPKNETLKPQVQNPKS